MRSSIFTPILSAALLAACSTQSSEPGITGGQPSPEDRSNCAALETRAPNAPDQQPAFAGQTRACATASSVAFDVTVLASGLVHPWAVEPLPDGNLLITERPGRMRIVSAAGVVGEPLTGLPAVYAQSQGGLLDVALSPDFASDRTIFWSFSEPRENGNGTSVARGVLSADRRSLEQVRVIFRSLPAYSNGMHYGSRLAFDEDGKLYITMGERSDKQMRPYAQRMDSHLGKVLRINPDGSVPSDNPFVGQPGTQPEIWTIGHRNVQASAFDADGDFWIVEHGTNGGDELNLIEKGENYGWPVQAYGEEYSGTPIAGAAPAPPDMEQPRYYWDPVIAPSGAQFYTGNAFPAWRNSLFVGGMKDKKLVRLIIHDKRVTGEENLLTDRNQRVRDVRQGPDGALYIVTDENNGQLWRIAPRQ